MSKNRIMGVSNQTDIREPGEGNYIPRQIIPAPPTYEIYKEIKSPRTQEPMKENFNLYSIVNQNKTGQVHVPQTQIDFPQIPPPPYVNNEVEINSENLL